jgi:hypothetical protein
MNPHLPTADLPPNELGLRAFMLTPVERALFHRSLRIGSPDAPGDYIEGALTWCDQTNVNARLVCLTLEGRVVPEVTEDGSLRFRAVREGQVSTVQNALREVMGKLKAAGTESAREPIAE